MAFNRTLSADGASDEFKGVNDVRIHGAGTFGGGTVALQEKQIDGTWADLVDGSFTADYDVRARIGVEQATLRFNLTGSTAPSITVSAKGEIS